MPNIAASKDADSSLREDMSTGTQEWFEERLREIKGEISGLTSRQTKENDYEYAKILRLNLHGMVDCLELISNNPPEDNESVDEYRNRLTGLINEFRVEGSQAQVRKPSVEITDYSNESLAGFWDSGVRSACRHLGLTLSSAGGT